MSVRIDAVLTGQAVAFGSKGEPSAIAKKPVTDVLSVGLLGLLGDEQGDLIHHGGIDKAVHHYPRDHYPFWKGELGDHPLLDKVGAFGENISTLGLKEDAICIGDRFRLGSAIVEVSQGRQPCWKLGHRFGNAMVPSQMVSSGKSGWYYRVIKPGVVCVGDTINLINRPCPNWTIALVFYLLIGGGSKKDRNLLRELAKLSKLSESWRSRAKNLAN